MAIMSTCGLMIVGFFIGSRYKIRIVKYHRGKVRILT